MLAITIFVSTRAGDDDGFILEELRRKTKRKKGPVWPGDGATHKKLKAGGFAENLVHPFALGMRQRHVPVLCVVKR